MMVVAMDISAISTKAEFPLKRGVVPVMAPHDLRGAARSDDVMGR